MLDKIKAFLEGCYKSATMWLCVALPAALSWALSNFDIVSQIVLDPSLSDQIKTAIGADPHVLAVWLKIAAGVAFVARARSIAMVAARK